MSPPVDVGEFTGFTGRLRKLAVRGSTYCYLDEQDAIHCSGESTRGVEDPPAGPYATLDVGGRGGACALDAEGTAYCWGDGGQTDPPAGPFTALALGDDNACGIRPKGFIECWGDGGFGFGGDSRPPSGTFVDLDVDDDVGCAINVDGRIQCWGGSGSPGTGDFVKVVTAGSSVCALDDEGTIACGDGYHSDTGLVPTDGPFLDFSLGNDHLCALREDGTVDCRSRRELGRLPPPEGPWSELRSDNRGTCARASDGRTECWGYGFGDGGADLQCDRGSSVLEGSIEAMPVNLSFDISTFDGFDILEEGFRFSYKVRPDEMRGPGVMFFDGDVDYSSGIAVSALQGQGEVPLRRVFVQPSSTGQDAGPIYCAGAGSGSTVSQHIDEVVLDLKNLHVQRCPGTPVDGELEICPFGCTGANGGSVSYRGTIDGATFEGQASQTGWATSADDDVGFRGASHELVRLRLGQDGEVPWGIIVMSPETEFTGDIYCADSTSSHAFDDDQRISYTLRGLSRLDPCPVTATDNGLAGCVR